MTASNFDLSSYLLRINYEGKPSHDLATLVQLLQKQLRAIPFENTEVQAGHIPSMVPEDIVNKVIECRRGGYCYEVNGTFAMALSALGFKYYFAGARPMLYEARRPKTHLVIVVELDHQKYLCDAGFGGYALRAPLLIKEGETIQDGEHLKLELLNDEYILSSFVQGEWQRQYGFALQAQEWIDFTLANYFNATHPDTIFTQKKLAIIQTPKGRKILVDNELKLIEEGKLERFEVEYESALWEHFGLKQVL